MWYDFWMFHLLSSSRLNALPCLLFMFGFQNQIFSNVIWQVWIGMNVLCSEISLRLDWDVWMNPLCFPNSLWLFNICVLHLQVVLIPQNIFDGHFNSTLWYGINFPFSKSFSLKHNSCIIRFSFWNTFMLSQLPNH